MMPGYTIPPTHDQLGDRARNAEIVMHRANEAVFAALNRKWGRGDIDVSIDDDDTLRADVHLPWLEVSGSTTRQLLLDVVDQLENMAKVFRDAAK